MTNLDSVRLDKWLWAVRLFKTRALATEACRLGRVSIAGRPAKPSRVVRLGDEIALQLPGLRRLVRVKGLLEKRVRATLVPDWLDDLTPPEQLEHERRERIEQRTLLPRRPPGSGRPTKAQRRALESWARMNELAASNTTEP